MEQKSLAELKQEIQIHAKKGVDFMLAAALLWLLIAYIWTLEYTSYDRSIMTFIAGALMLPLAFAFSKILKTNWKVKNNPLDPLGLWLNFAQLLYFPFLVFILLKDPDYFIMAYAIITGAHLFPYAWFYDEMGYAVWAVLISVGSLLIALNVEVLRIWFIPMYTSILFFLLAFWIFRKVQKQTLSP
jgi:hypothetical protein